MRKTSRKGYRRSQRGQALVLIAFGMIVFLAFLVLAIDGSKYYDQRRIAQNAADAGSLAGLYQYEHPDTPGNNKDGAVFDKIAAAADKNHIPDAANNVWAFWINSFGDYVNHDNTTVSKTTEPPPSGAQITSGSTLTKPAGAGGIKVRTFIPYTSFIGQFVGWKDLRTQADGTALISLGSITYSDTNSSLWMGGGTCNTVANPAFNWSANANSNNADFGDGLYVAGAAVKGDGGLSGQFPSKYPPKRGDVIVRGPTNGAGGTGDPYGPNPITAYDYYGPGNPPPGGYPSNQWPDWAYIKRGEIDADNNWPPAKTLIQTYLFKPDSALDPTVDTPAGGAPVPSGLTDDYIFKGYVRAKANGADLGYPSFAYHYIDMGPDGSDADANGDALKAMVTSGKQGVFFIQGDLHTKAMWPDGVTVIVTGKIELGDGSPSNPYGNAKFWGYGITMMAGGTGSNKCAASDNFDNAVIWTQGVGSDPQINDANWTGVMYAPNGLVALDGNYALAKPGFGMVIAYSMGVAWNHPGNNQHLDGCSGCLVHPIYVMGLNQ